MRSDPATAIPKRRAFDTSARIQIANVFNLESRISLSLPAIIVGLAGAAGIVYVATSHPQPAALPPAGASDAIETSGVTLVK